MTILLGQIILFLTHRTRECNAGSSRFFLFSHDPSVYSIDFLKEPNPSSPCSDLNRGPHSYQECALPTELHGHKKRWAEADSNHRRRCQLIYSQPPLSTRVSAHKKPTVGIEPTPLRLQGGSSSVELRRHETIITRSLDGSKGLPVPLAAMSIHNYQNLSTIREQSMSLN